MPARPVVATLHSPQKLQRELADLQLVMRARNGDSKALDELIRRYQGFVRLNFGCPRTILTEGLDRMRAALAALP